MGKQNPLFERIEQFQKDKKKIIPVLILLGLVGLILPILPGVPLLLLVFMLIFPQQGDKLMERFDRLLGLARTKARKK